MTKYYINLTNGIEAIPKLNTPYSFIRIQSTTCEQHQWDKLIMELDYNFLMDLALGHKVVVYDYGANKPAPKALYQGIPIISYILNRHWYGRSEITYFSRKPTSYKINATRYCKNIYEKLDKHTIKKLNYFKPYISQKSSFQIEVVANQTRHDGDKTYYRNILLEA